MPSVNPIRKQILRALEEHILPALWLPGLSMGYVAPPLNFSGHISARLLRPSVPRQDTSAIEFPLQSRWPSANLHSSHYPYFGFLYEGAADEKTLVTQKQAAKYRISKGIYAIRWRAPAVLLFPSRAARSDGNSQFWESVGAQPSMRCLWLSIGEKLLMHTHTYIANEERQVSHSLQVDDPDAISLMALYMQAMKPAFADKPLFAQTVLLAVMQRLHGILITNKAKIANTSRSPILPIIVSPDDSAVEPCRDAAIYIQMHLHEALTLVEIAKHVQLSPAHLNRLFGRVYGISVMRYVRTQRVAAAKNILIGGSESVAEIAQLVGYKRANLFCRTFREETGSTPSQFRRRARREKYF